MLVGRAVHEVYLLLFAMNTRLQPDMVVPAVPISKEGMPNRRPLKGKQTKSNYLKETHMDRSKLYERYYNTEMR